MKPEELKMLLDAFKAATAAGQEAFMWWLAADAASRASKQQ